VVVNHHDANDRLQSGHFLVCPGLGEMVRRGGAL
jgi:hypothetical protein